MQGTFPRVHNGSTRKLIYSQFQGFIVGDGMAEAIGDAEGIEGMDGIEGIAGMLGETVGAGGAVGIVCAVATPVAATAIVLPARTMPINQRFTLRVSFRSGIERVVFLSLTQAGAF